MDTSSYPPGIDSRRIVNVDFERVSNVSSTDFPGHYPGEDNSWDLQRFKQTVKVVLTRLSNRTCEFDLIGVDASIANAIRRTLIADVPTIAIEHVYVMNNTSVIVDEVLAHRLGLVPLNVDPALFEMRDESGDATDRDTLVFKLNVTCTRKAKQPRDGDMPEPDLLYDHHTVTAGDLVWEAQGEQAELEHFKKKPPGPTNPNIVLGKLRPGQEISIDCHAVKGVGKEHAKWSPVATATYRLHPFIHLLRPPPKNLSAKFQSCFAPGVVRIDRSSGLASIDPAKMRNETMSREVLRHQEFEGCVKLGRVRDWFLFSVESESAYVPERLVPEAIKVLRGRIAVLKKAAEALLRGDEEEEVAVGTRDTAGDGQWGTGLEAATTGNEGGDVVMMDS